MSDTLPSNDHVSSTSAPDAARFAVPHRRNQLLAATLISVVTGLFVIVVGLVILLHYAETHHIMAEL